MVTRRTSSPPPALRHRRLAAVRDLARRLVWHWVAVVVLSLAGGAAFAALGEEVFEHETGSFDSAVRDWALAHQAPGWRAFFLAVTRAGSPLPIVLLVAPAAAWLWRSRGRWLAAAVVLAPAAATAAFVGVKDVIRRRRPPGALLLHELAFSFPSGHATTSAAVVGTVMYVLAREGLVGRGAALATAAVVPLLIGLSRVYLDVHWATDVLGGWCLGLCIAALSAGVYERLRARARRTLGPGVPGVPGRGTA